MPDPLDGRSASWTVEEEYGIIEWRIKRYNHGNGESFYSGISGRIFTAATPVGAKMPQPGKDIMIIVSNPFKIGIVFKIY